MMPPETAFLFDLDGTLVDSVYDHVLAWHDALVAEGIELSFWRIHRKIGMSGGLFTNMLLRETGREISEEHISRLRRLHAENYSKRSALIRPLPGARELLSLLTGADIPWAIATSGRIETRCALPSPIPISSSKRRIVWALTSAMPAWWATASGTCGGTALPLAGHRSLSGRLWRG